MSRRLRLLAFSVAAALLAVACSGASGESSESSDGESTGSGPTPIPSATPTPSVPLFSPTESTEPFDLSGGATSADEGVTVVLENPRARMIDIVRQATRTWDTDWTRQAADLNEFLLGIAVLDPRDRIPPIDTPKFEPIANATWLGEREPGALVQLGEEVRFYPLSILTRHEIVNDRIGDVPVAITYCPLCNTALTFDRRVDGEVLRFGVSGLLRNSDLVMWDDLTTSLWQQITGEGVVGEYAGTQLEIIPTAIVSYADAVENFPDALSLAQDTGFPGARYGLQGYGGYSSSPAPFAFAGEPDPRFPALSRVVGVTLEDESKAYPFSEIREVRAVNDVVAGVPVAVFWGGDTADALDDPIIAEGQAIGSGLVLDRRVGERVLTFSPAGDDQFVDEETGSTWTLLGLAVDGPLVGEQLDPVPHRNEFWFAWAAFFPDAAVYEQP